MIRIFHMSINNITADPEGAAENLLNSVLRDAGTRITGVCDIGMTLSIVMEDSDAPLPLRFVFSPFRDSSEESVTVEIRNRYNAGYSTLGAFHSPDGALWGLFVLADIDLYKKSNRNN